MASVIQDRRSKFWIAKFRDAAGKQIARSTKIPCKPEPLPDEDAAAVRRRRVENERAARLLADEWEEAFRGNRTEAQLRKVFEDVTRATQKRAMDFPTCREYLSGWLERESATLAKATRQRYKGVVAAFFKSLAAENREAVHLTDIRPDDFENFKSERINQGIAASTVRNDLKILNIAFAAAMRTGKIRTNPAAAVRPPDRASARREAFSESEIEAILAEAEKREPELTTPILLGAFAGLRVGDAVTLSWEAVDLLNKTIRLTPEKTRRSGRELVLPLHPRIEKHLLELPTPEAPGAPLCPELVGCKSGGTNGLSKRFRDLMRHAAVEQKTTEGTGRGREFNAKTFHSLRHTFISRLQAANVPPDLRMSLAGHTDSGTHRGYTHTEIETLRAAVAKL